MIYSVTVKPGSKKGPLVVEVSTDILASPVNPQLAAKNLTVYLREKPVDGAANTALVKLLAKHFDVAKSCVIIRSGASSRHKIVEIIGR